MLGFVGDEAYYRRCLLKAADFGFARIRRGQNLRVLLVCSLPSKYRLKMILLMPSISFFL